MFFLSRFKGYIQYFKKTDAFSPGVYSRTRKKIILLCANVIFATAGGGIIAPVLPEIQTWGNFSTVQIGIFVSSFALARVVANIPAGFLSDRYKRHFLTAIGLLIALSGLLVTAFAVSFYFLVIGRVVAGLGSSLVAVSIQTELLSLAAFNNRSKFMSYFMMSHRTGDSIFPFIGGALAFFINWRAVFLFCALLNLIGIAIALTPSRKSNIELTVEIDETAGPLPQTFEKESKQDPGLLQKDGKPLFFLALYLLVFFVFLNRSGLEMTILPLYGNAIGLNSFQIGTALSISSIVSLGAILGGGYLADRYGRKLILQIGLVILLLANGLFLLVTSFWAFLFVKVLFGIAAFTTALPTVIATDSVHPSRMGRALGGVRLFNDIGRLTGPAGLGWVMDRYGFPTTIGVSITTLITSTLLTTIFLEKTGSKSLRIMKNTG